MPSTHLPLQTCQVRLVLESDNRNLSLLLPYITHPVLLYFAPTTLPFCLSPSPASSLPLSNFCRDTGSIMPQNLKRKAPEADQPSLPAIPSALPPSVEEAYRRKCIQLRNRTNEVEDANDAARLRLARIRRQVEKLRIERAFLLEQLTRRTSTNVEDSDGSPSPPPTV